MKFGRAFELSSGEIILPCEFCGNPVFDINKHMCKGFLLELLQEAQNRDI